MGASDAAARAPARRSGARLLAAVLLPAPDGHRRYAGDAVRLGLGSAGLLATGLVSAAGRPSAVESDIFAAVNGLPNAATPLLWTVMQAGGFAAVFVAGGLALAARRPRLAAALLTGGSATWLAAKGIKLLVDRGRPGSLLLDVIIRGPAASGLGFPSGHAAVAAVIMTVAGPYLTRPARIVGWVAVTLVAFARVFIGVHLPLDAVGGVLFGWSVGSLVNLLFGRPAPSTSPASLPRG